MAGKPEIITTVNPRDIVHILDPDVRAIRWKRGQRPDVDCAAKAFCARGYRQIFNVSAADDDARANRGFDKDQIMIERHRQRLFPELGPVWDDRRRVKDALERVLHTGFYVNQLQVQPAERRTPDHIPHQDRGTLPAGRKKSENLKLIATIAHIRPGTIILPKADAGRQTPDPHGARRFFYHPPILDNVVRAQTHDVVILKTGPQEGAVHFTPDFGRGLRLLSFMMSDQSYLQCRREHALAKRLIQQLCPDN